MASWQLKESLQENKDEKCLDDSWENKERKKKHRKGKWKQEVEDTKEFKIVNCFK